MVLSKQHKFVFIKGKKVAGTSVEVLLSAVCGAQDIITPITLIDERYRVTCGQRAAQNYGVNKHKNNAYLASLIKCSDAELANIKNLKGQYYNHISLLQIVKLYGAIPADWIIFAIVRHPYNKVLSLVNWCLQAAQYKKNGVAMKNDASIIRQHFNKMLADGEITNTKNIDLYKDDKGNVKVDILRYENLEKEISNMMLRLGISSYPPLQHFKKGLYLNPNPLDIFDKQQIQTINKLYDEEFDCFGYNMA